MDTIVVVIVTSVVIILVVIVVLVIIIVLIVIVRVVVAWDGVSVVRGTFLQVLPYLKGTSNLKARILVGLPMSSPHPLLLNSKEYRTPLATKDFLCQRLQYRSPILHTINLIP